MFPCVTKQYKDFEQEYPIRNLPSDAVVSRIAPSPNGFVHLGNLYNAVICERIVRQTGGIFYQSIDDTDNKREVSGAVQTIITAMEHFGIVFDEGAIHEGDKGEYDPFRQRQRKEIYQAYAKMLVEQGLAYPCFCTEEHL